MALITSDCGATRSPIIKSPCSPRGLCGDNQVNGNISAWQLRRSAFPHDLRLSTDREIGFRRVYALSSTPGGVIILNSIALNHSVRDAGRTGGRPRSPARTSGCGTRWCERIMVHAANMDCPPS